ncbi:hypothetical protein DDB_G0276635 [Dictyostelium discoideum AX4]|uniref:Uncharacterized protein n=1 Tax=Dictyostelium discoideum TaxID=44689 RepID=Q551E7_DICDI|nr:hypothetical protein DDB_G0276635 [Dictyostelium discoideum AX4]EAL69130.1 hypothetical protein DDB_G0276635 [Dictyostelium discoideum AX4]|eukprot:XP_643046.1 hypothetical protein DDB_G0276635 [Dictyostelium discoideum AX4]
MLLKSLISISNKTNSSSLNCIHSETPLNNFSKNEIVSIKNATSFFTRPNFLNF